MTEAPSTTPLYFQFWLQQAAVQSTFGKHTDFLKKSKINQKGLFHHPLNDESDKPKSKSDLKKRPHSQRTEENRGKHTSSPEQKKTSTEATLQHGGGARA